MVGGGHAWQGDMHGGGGGMCAGETAVRGTHPTGMHTCLKYFLLHRTK